MTPADYQSVYEFAAEQLAHVEAHADLFFSGQYTVTRVKGGGWVGCYGPPSGLTLTRAYALTQAKPDEHPPCVSLEHLHTVMATVTCLYEPLSANVPLEAYMINSLVSKVELHAAAFHGGEYSLLRTDAGRYVGAYGPIRGTTPRQRAMWVEYDALDTLLVMMAEHPDQHNTDGWDGSRIPSLE
jgi:hypothetical protein